MRFGRIILIGLAPLLSLSALAAAVADPPSAPNGHQNGPLMGLLRSVAQLVTPAAESAAILASPERPSPQALLGVAVLAGTRLANSLWMVTHPAPVNLFERRHLRAPLRC